MMNLHKFLDEKHGIAIGRVYMLILLFLFNALIPIGAVLFYLYASTPMVLAGGIVGSVITIAILSTPTKVKESGEK